MLASHRHPSIEALLKQDGGTDPVAAMRRRARDLVAKARALGWEGPPFDIHALASLRGLRVSFDHQLKRDQDACVMPGLVLLNPTKPRVRQRYSLAHELAHTLFPDYEEELKLVGRLWRRDADDSELEQLCQVAGAELLMPLNAFREAVRSEGQDLAAVLRLAEAFDASPEATVRRVIETDSLESLGILLRPIDPESGEWIEVDRSSCHAPYAPLGVFSSWSSDACSDTRISRGTAPPSKGAADRAWKRVSLTQHGVSIERRAWEDWTHAGVSGAWQSEALTLPKTARAPREVLCLLRRLVS